MASHISFILVSLFNILLLISLLRQVSGKRMLNPTPQEDYVDGMCKLMVLPRGYKCEEHEVVTGDGYILSMQRIPFGKNGGVGTVSRPPVLIQHGVVVDGVVWVLNSPEESLAFFLADNGFDVWISNTRGTRFSRRHTSLDPASKSYWNWSWDDLVTNDFPATVDFVSKQTGQKIHYVGHSMGTLVPLASFSEQKSVDKLKSAAFLSPIAYLTHMTTPIGMFAAKAFVGEFLTNWLGMAEFNPTQDTVRDIIKIYCATPGIHCYNLMRAITGNNCCLNASNVELFLKYEPQPTSTKTMVHFAQTVRSGKLTKYDYGSDALNMKNYGQRTPPVYNLTNISKDIPLFLSYGGRDALSDVKDVQRLLDELKYHPIDKLSVQFVEDFAHADFMIGDTAKDVVYKTMISFFLDHNT